MKLSPTEFFKAERVARAADATPYKAFLTKDLMPKLTPPILHALKADLYHDLARIGLAMARYRADHGQLPESPDLLVPDYLKAWPADPFDGKPMRLVASTESVTVYSIGPNFIDDGGHTALDHTDPKMDVTFRLKK